MQHSASTLWLLSALVLLCGCGGGVRTSRSPSGLPSGPPSDPSPQGLTVAGNWQFSTTSAAGMPPFIIAGNITQSGNAVNGVVHVDGWSCFDQPTAIGLTGTLTDGKISLTSVSVDGQVITLAGTISKKIGFPYTLTGTYAINGGCANGEQGNITGFNVDSITGNWAGNLTTAGAETIHWGAQLAQGNASSEGSFGLTGPFTFDGACFKSGTITSGTFPSASFIMGTSVALEIKTDNGTIVFLGTADSDGLIRGSYAVSGGLCPSTGTGYLSPWEY